MKKIAIVGSGPSAFFTADALLRHHPALEVDLFERMPVPFGLVRYGVAPDRQKIKAVAAKFHTVAGRGGFRFHGNVGIGSEVGIDDLAAHFHAVVVASGASTSRDLGIPGEHLPGSYAADAFSGWYNGHPDHAGLAPDLDVEEAVVVGQGNVALDVARILAAKPESLRGTDLPAGAWETLRGSRIRTIHIVGRRGPAEARFSVEELEALAALEGCSVRVPQADVGDRKASGVVGALRDLSRVSSRGTDRRVVLHFLRSPLEITGPGRVDGILLEKNALAGPGDDPKVRGTGERVGLACGLVIRCVGFRAEPPRGLPFDAARGIVPNEAGRVAGAGAPKGVYVAGWIKHGPRGLIGHARRDARQTAAAVLEDLAQGAPPPPCRGAAPLLEALRQRGIRTTTWEDWLRIDAHERAEGARLGKVREKIVDTDEMLRVADALDG